MNISKLVTKLQEAYPHHGLFDLLPGELISQAVRCYDVPNTFGIYLIFDGLGGRGKLIYVGRAGTIRQDGTPKDQGLAKRMKRKQGKEPRNNFFRRFISEGGLDGLSFMWFETFNREKPMTLPALAEAEILQEYFAENRCLPRLNRAV